MRMPLWKAVILLLVVAIIAISTSSAIYHHFHPNNKYRTLPAKDVTKSVANNPEFPCELRGLGTNHPAPATTNNLSCDKTPVYSDTTTPMVVPTTPHTIKPATPPTVPPREFCSKVDAFCITFPTPAVVGFSDVPNRSATGVVSSRSYTTSAIMPIVVVYRSTLTDPRRALLGDRNWNWSARYTTWKGLPAVTTSSRVEEENQTEQTLKVWHNGRIYVLFQITKDGEQAITDNFFGSLRFTD